MDKARRVLVLTTSFPAKGITDMGHFVEDDCIALLNSGHKVRVLAPSPNYLPPSAKKGYDLRYFNYFFPQKIQRLAYGSGIPINLKNSYLARIQLPFFFLSFIISAFKYSKQADIIHCHWFPAGLVGAIIKSITGKKIVLTMHHTHSSNAIFRWILKKCDFLLCNSAYTLKMTSEIYPVEKTAIMPLRVDTNEFKPDENSSNTSFFRILFVGRLIDIKGPDILVKAFDIFRKKTGAKDSQLEIVGDGPMKSSLIAMSKEFGISDSIHFVGRISRNNLPSYYQRSSVFVIPSIELEGGEVEGLGLTAMEASSCGIPVIGSDSGGIPESIEHNCNGILFNSGDEIALSEALTQLYSNPSLSQKLGQEGRRRAVSKNNIENNYKTLISAYNSII